MAIARWLDKNFEYVILAVLLMVLSFFSFGNVVLRYCFGSSIIWADEVCRYALVLSGFFSIPCWVRNGTGIRVDALLLVLPVRVRNVCEYFVDLIMIALFAYLLKGTDMVIAGAIKINLLSPALRLPMFYLYYTIWFAFFLSLVRLVQAVTARIRSDFFHTGSKGVSA